MADTLCYPGLTVSSLTSATPLKGSRTARPTVVRNFSPPRDGGHFRGQRAFGAVTFNHLVESNNYITIENTTSTFSITVNH